MILRLEAYFTGNQELIMTRDLKHFDAHSFIKEFFDWFNFSLEQNECVKFQATLKYKNKIVFRQTDLRGCNRIQADLLASVLLLLTPTQNV